MRTALRNISRIQQRNTHEAMPDDERDCRPLLLRERQDLRSNFAHHLIVERYENFGPAAGEYRE